MVSVTLNGSSFRPSTLLSFFASFFTTLLHLLQLPDFTFPSPPLPSWPLQPLAILKVFTGTRNRIARESAVLYRRYLFSGCWLFDLGEDVENGRKLAEAAAAAARTPRPKQRKLPNYRRVEEISIIFSSSRVRRHSVGSRGCPNHKLRIYVYTICIYIRPVP